MRAAYGSAMGHERANVDRASQSVRADSQQRDKHVEYAWRGRFAQIGRETAAFKRADWYWKNLLSVFRERAWVAIGALAQRGAKCESCDFEHVADPGARRRAHFVWIDGVGPAQAS